MARQFERVVFADEYDETRRIRRVRKWTGPVRIALHGEKAARYRPVVEAYARELAGVAALSITVPPEPGNRANLDIHFVPWDDMEVLAKPWAPNPTWLRLIIQASSCLFIFRRNDRWEITGAIILVSTNEPFDHNRKCLLEEMTQVLGLPNDSGLIRESVFHEAAAFDRLPRADRILVRTLYDPRLTSGMPKGEALAQARRIIAEQVGR